MCIASEPTCWAELVFLEPRLLDVERRCEAYVELCGRSWPAYGWGKRQFARLVGWTADADGDPRLRTSHAYEITICRLTDLVAPGWGPDE